MLRSFLTLMGILVLLSLAGGGSVLYVFYKFGQGLPAHTQLADYEPPVMTRVHAGDGRLLAEYAIEKRAFVPIKAMPQRVIRAFLSAEDKNFYYHPGIDFTGLLRAVLINIKNIGQGRRLVGASTITQQVAKNFLLTNEVSYTRKIKEAILAFRIERALEKDRILELYLNEIYLGIGSYGVAAASLNYFNKSMDELTIAETAFLAALPKAPNNYNPRKHLKAAIERRNWVIGRMVQDKVITQAEADAAKTHPLIVEKRSATEFVNASFYTEEVRRELAHRYGDEKLYKGGLSVRTTLDPRLQEIADRELKNGLSAYDRRHGWRGPVKHFDTPLGWLEELDKVKQPKGSEGWDMAVVMAVDDSKADIALSETTQGTIPLSELKWARAWKKDQKRGPQIRKASEVLKAGDVVLVEKITHMPKAKDEEEAKPYPEGTFGLRQVPAVQGGVVALDPHTGRVLAMSGGFSYEQSQFNRATQAKRQPGSAFKPFVYLAGIDAGLTPSTLVLDAPFVIDQGPGKPKWRPANYTKKFYGPRTMRFGVEKSKNLMTVRLAQTIGMEKIADYAKRFNIYQNLPQQLSMSLGAGETSLLQMTTAYAMLVNGGKRIIPTLIDRIQDRHGKTIFKHDERQCQGCVSKFWTNQPVPEIPDERESVTDAASAYQIVSILHGVVKRGTGRRINKLGIPLAGKTGTTNDSFDSWFVGFSPDLALGIYVGFDTPRTLGKKETGSSVAAPIFKDIMGEALKDKPNIPFRIPPGVRLVRVNAKTGALARPGDRDIILEAFKPGTIPTGEMAVIEGVSDTISGGTEGFPASGTGGLY
ncbi:MAG: penicillin-binding protein 1A [Alphaproteobacteria bacterium]|nr:penicillin-binding protein 1A [Alphaproteobacteria bacterium]